MKRATQLELWTPATLDDHWYGCSCKAVWLAVVAFGARDWARARRWQA